MGSSERFYNVKQWIEENNKFFFPPVCNKMMHKEGQMKHFFVGGPNQRKDYHIECGEELFLQIKGDMVLKVVEQNKHRDVSIKEGQLFLLPGRIPHSPQRFQDTVGMVIERDRHPDTEIDGLRYFVELDGEPSLESLYEKWFYCEDLGIQLAPIIKEFFASEQYETGKPIPGTLPKNLPFELDTETLLEDPFNLQEWIERNRDNINKQGRVAIFDTDKYQFQVYMYGKGDVSDTAASSEAWVWQREGESELVVGDTSVSLAKDDSYLVPMATTFTVKQKEGSRALVCYQDPTKAPSWPSQQQEK